MRLSQRALDAAPHKQPIVDAVQAGPGLVLDHEPIAHAFIVTQEMTFVPSVGQSALTAHVFDERVRVQAAQGHVEPYLSTEQADDNHGLVPWSTPPGVGLDADEARPVLRPVGDVRDVGEAGLD